MKLLKEKLVDIWKGKRISPNSSIRIDATTNLRRVNGVTTITREFFSFQTRLIWYWITGKGYAKQNPQVFLLPLLFLIPELQTMGVFVALAIAFDAATGFYDAGTSDPVSFSHTNGTGDDRLLTVGIGIGNPDAGAIQSMTYNSVGMSVAASISTNNWNRIYYLVAPATGSNTVEANFDDPKPDIGMGAVSFTGVDQSDPIGATATASFDGTSVNRTITTDTANSLIIDCITVNGDNKTPSAISGQTVYWNVGTSSDRARAGSTRVALTAQEYTMGWTFSSISGNITTAEIHQVAAVGPANLKTLDTVAKANVKTINTVPIASVKTWDTIE
jgi:hypothetical protein